MIKKFCVVALNIIIDIINIINIISLFRNL